MISVRSLVYCLVLGAGVVSSAQSQDLPRRKPGLWEAQMTSKSPETPAMQQKLAAMPPEQRAQMEAMMKQHGMNIAAGPDGSVTQTMRMCVTPQDVAEENRQSLMARMQQHRDRDSQCDDKIMKRTSSEITFHTTCRTKEGVMDVEGRIFDMSPEHFAMDIKGRSPQKGDYEMHQRTRWLGSDCGNVK